jgi:lipopolysaccharide transport system permease protein
MVGLLRDIWRYRGLVQGSIRREIVTQYRGSLLGATWVLIGPAAMILIYTLVFSQLMRSRLTGVDSAFGYSVFLCAGLLPWTFFTELLTRLQAVFVVNANLMKKAMFPRICLPIIALGTAGFNFAVIASLFLVFLVVSGSFPGPVLLAALPALAVQVALAMGFGMLFATLNVFFRDVGQAVTLLLQFWFWLTPIVYPVNALPAELRSVMDFNPMFPLISAFQVILVNGQWPDWVNLWPVVMLATLLCLFGFGLFRRHAGEMVDEL